MDSLTQIVNKPYVILVLGVLVVGVAFILRQSKGKAKSLFTVPEEGGALQRMPNEDGFVRLKLIQKIEITHDTYIFRFGFDDPDMTFGLPIGNHVVFKAKINGQDTYRKYTPITDVTRQSFVDFCIKIYRANVHPRFPEGGKMTMYLETLQIGDSMLMEGPKGKLQYFGHGQFNILRQQPIVRKQIGHIAGGTGITPCFHVLQSSLRNNDGVKHSMIFGNRTINDILLHEELKELAQNNPDVFKIFFTVDIQPSAEDNWKQGVGFVTDAMIKQHMPAPGPDTLILFCGPPPFTDMLENVLPKLGYTPDMIFKF